MENHPARPLPSEAGLLDEAAGQPLTLCFACGRCTSGCPMAPEMDLKPHALIRLLLANHTARVLASRAIWVCAGCHACSSRCPNGLSPASLIERLRGMALQEQSTASGADIVLFHRDFLRQLRWFGRQYELGFSAALALRAPELRRDWRIGWRLWRAGRLGLLPVRSRRRRLVRKILQAAPP